MRWAVAQGYREDNPTGDAIGAALPKSGGRPQHHAALPFSEVCGAIERVRASRAYPTTVLAFEFPAPTAGRSSEVRGARWGEIDFGAQEWRIPGRTDEGEAGTPGSAVHAGAGQFSGRRARDQLRSGVPCGARPPALGSRGLEADPRARDSGGASRVPVELPGLGGGMFRRAARGLRTRSSPRELGPSGGCVPARGPVRA